MTSTYITTTIPYVNARPHLGFALELVQADVLARYHRSIGDQVRLQSGTDDNSLKNVLAARAAGVGVQEFVDANATAFTGLAGPLSLSIDDLIRTSSDPRHRAGVERLWRACAASGDLYRKRYEGLYCVGCEQFYAAAELEDGRCPDHGTVPDQVCEENWFFRLSRYAGQVRDLMPTPRSASSQPNDVTRSWLSSTPASRTSPCPAAPSAPAAGASLSPVIRAR
jgi:methionyl-tRNA synthetase